jgi:RNA polymerase sigma-70 factor (ECF subfamily)
MPCGAFAPKVLAVPEPIDRASQQRILGTPCPPDGVHLTLTHDRDAPRLTSKSVTHSAGLRVGSQIYANPPAGEERATTMEAAEGTEPSGSRLGPETLRLIARAQGGDREATSELFESFYSTVFAMALRRVNRWDEAEELTQEVFIQAMRKLAQLRVPEAFVAWLRQIVHRLAINRAAGRKLVASLADEAAVAAAGDGEDGAYAVSVRREEAASLRDSLSRLGGLDRETLSAFYFDGQSLLEMSETFAAPLGTIKRRLHVARKRLAKELDPIEVG